MNPDASENMTAASTDRPTPSNDSSRPPSLTLSEMSCWCSMRGRKDVNCCPELGSSRKAAATLPTERILDLYLSHSAVALGSAITSLLPEEVNVGMDGAILVIRERRDDFLGFEETPVFCAGGEVGMSSPAAAARGSTMCRGVLLRRLVVSCAAPLSPRGAKSRARRYKT